MAKITQYPHHLFMEAIAVDSYQDENGNWMESESSLQSLGSCREESGSNTEYQVANGQYHKSSATIYCPKDCPTIPIGAKVFVANDAECRDVRITGECLKFEASQFHCRLWV